MLLLLLVIVGLAVVVTACLPVVHDALGAVHISDLLGGGGVRGGLVVATTHKPAGGRAGRNRVRCNSQSGAWENRVIVAYHERVGGNRIFVCQS